MGYSERLCQLCGVSFNIARIRTSHEPYEAGWDYYGSGHVRENEQCDESTGCGNTDAGEHLAGPRCKSGSGYSANRISLIEMKGINQVQCLVWKHPGWIPEEDDEDFELDGHCFLTAPSIGAPGEWDTGPLAKVRHGVREYSIKNGLPAYSVGFSIDDSRKYDGAPFHVACFDIFKRVSKEHFGFVNLDGLWCLHEDQGDFDGMFIGLDRGSAVNKCVEQFWYHQIGTEYLAANPVSIPDLNLLMEATGNNPGWAHIPCSPCMPQQHCQDESATRLSPPSSDIFAPLPLELQMQILGHLHSKDIANLRLVSRCFRHLPVSLFRQFIKQDMPWFWEVDEFKCHGERDWFWLYMQLKDIDTHIKGLANRKRIWHDVEEIVSRIEKMAERDGSIEQSLVMRAMKLQPPETPTTARMTL